MQIPQGMTEQEVLDVIDNVARRLARRFKFGYHDIDDMRQEARLLALEGLNSYDGKRPLENFLWTHVRNRLFNFKRHNYVRPDKPCKSCPLYDPHCKVRNSQCQEFDNKEDCDLYAKWVRRNSAKKNLMTPIDLADVRDELEKNMRVNDSVLDSMCETEISDLLDREIPVSLRKDYLCLKNNVKLPKKRREKIQEVVITILQDNGLWDE